MSESYRALYRKWRPETFDDIVGQQHITNTLKHEIAKEQISHAYLFCGTRGTGKTSTAKIFSRAVNCENPHDGEPCNKCETCMGISDGRIFDVYEMDAASNNGVDNIRELRDEVAYSPVGCKYKVYIIDEAHMLTAAAFNALLKTLEEPPSHALFILATTEPQKIPQTILSRCQRYDFKRISDSDIAMRMKKVAAAEGINATEDALELIAELGDGSMRDALSVLERCASFGGAELRQADVSEIVGIVDNSVLFEISECVANGDTGGAIEKLDRLLNMGKDVLNFFEECIEHFRSILLCKECANPEEVVEKSMAAIEKYKLACEKFTSTHLIYAITTLNEYHGMAKSMSSPNIAAELALVKISNPIYAGDISSILTRLEKLEKRVSSGAVQPMSKPAQNQVDKAQDLPPWDDDRPQENTDETPNIAVDETKPKEDKKFFDNPSSTAEWSAWPEALEIIKNNSKKLYMYMYKSHVVRTGNFIDIELSIDSAYERVSTADGLDYLSGLFSDVAGEKLRARVFKKGNRPSGDTPHETSIMDLVNKKDKFDDIINVKE